LINLKQRIVCVLCEPKSADGNNAFIAKKWSGELPKSEVDFQKFVQKCQERIEIEFNSAPSGISQRTKRKIDQSYDKDVSLSDIARSLKTRATVMGRAFKKDFGVSPVTYRNHLRITMASLALTDGKTVTDVASEVGFEDLSRFNKNFKAMTRTQPKRFKPKKSKNAKF
jgi:AraC-like DNA-binding protein